MKGNAKAKTFTYVRVMLNENNFMQVKRSAANKYSSKSKVHFCT